MGTVERHDLDQEHAERAAARLTARRQDARDDIETDQRGPGYAMDCAYREFTARCVADRRAAEDETWLAMARARQAGTALFLLATRPEGEPVEFHYGEDLIRRPATGPTADSGAPTWLRAVYLAIVARDATQLDLLASVPLDLLRAGPNEHVFAWVRTLRAYVRGDAGVVEAVLEAMRATEDLSPATVAQYVKTVDLPPMAAFYAFTQGDPANFTAALTSALELHKRKWADEPRDPMGAVPLALLAVACLARDAGLPADVDSDYLPQDLLAGTRAGDWRRSAAAQPMRALARTVERHALELTASESSDSEFVDPASAMRRSFAEFGRCCATDERAAWNDTWLAMVRALQAGAALFQLATRPDGELVEFRYGDEVVRRPATGPTPECTAQAWLQTMYLAIVARDRARIDLLAAVPLDLLGRDPWVRALQVFARGEQSLVDAVLAAMRVTEGLQFAPVELFYHYTQRADVEFATALRDALDLHKRHWGTDPRNPAGAVALGPLAMACLARDAGMPIDVESPYLPHHLLTGSRVGELTT